MQKNLLVPIEPIPLNSKNLLTQHNYKCQFKKNLLINNHKSVSTKINQVLQIYHKSNTSTQIAKNTST